MEKRVTDLELRFMHQEKTIQELNQVVSRQDLVIELLRREITAMREHAMSIALPVTGGAEETPPHY